MVADVICAGHLYPGTRIEKHARLLAGGLNKLGVGDGGVIAVMLRNGPVFAEVIRAARMLGAYYCPINWHFKQDEAGYILRDCGARVLIIHADLLPSIQEGLPQSVVVLAVQPELSGQSVHAGESPDFSHWLEAQPWYGGPVRQPRGHMPYTSGTTGRPKGVRRTAVPSERKPDRPISRVLIPAPLYHSAPTGIAQQSLEHGDLLVFMEQFDPEELLLLIDQHRIVSLYAVPVMYVRLLRLPKTVRDRYDISSLRYVVSTGAAYPPDVKQAMLDWWGECIHELYGSSETGMITLQDPESARRKPRSVGKPLPHTEVRILDEMGRTCEAGQIGTIYVRGSTDFTYHNNPQARSEVELGQSGLITLGDMGYLDEEGYLYMSDRASDMVISGGVNIYPAEIENALLSLPGTLDCAVLGVPDDEYGESLAALVVSTPDAGENADRIRQELRSRLANFKVPKIILFVGELPRDANGKLPKRQLRHLLIDRPVHSDPRYPQTTRKRGTHDDLTC